MRLPQLINKQLAMHEALRRLGFPSDDIYVAFYNAGELFTELHQGELRFRASISEGQRIDPSEYQPMWETACRRWNDPKLMSEGQRKRIYEENFLHRAVDLILALKAKDFVIQKESDA